MTETSETTHIVFHYGLAEWELHPRDFSTVESVTAEYRIREEAGEAFIFFSLDGEHVAVVPTPGVAAYATQADPHGRKRHEAHDAAMEQLASLRQHEPTGISR
ncbi:hypothetical protein O3783_06710 [Micrococcus luteus]|uniref:hypothetical protein n=1 Tax=Micrococcus luteus TaxID=1270 RepID=UPI00352BE323|nr:hypothetical protein [Micrococcus luteus]